MVSKPQRSSAFMYCAFDFEGIKCDLIPCMASRGHSMSFTVFIPFKYTITIMKKE
jgi:hypothetical protein